MQNLIRYETHAGEPISIKGAKLVPFTQVLSIKIPGMLGGFLWERPVSVLVQKADGEEIILPVQDITRIVIWALSGAVALTWLFTRNYQRK
jgi:hypothetical protein